MSKRRASEEDCSKTPQKRKSTVNMSGRWSWGNKEDASTSQGKLKFRRSGNESEHPLATEFIKQLTKKIPSLTEVSAEEEEEDIFLVFSPKGTNENLPETKPTIFVVLHENYPEDSVLDTSSTSSSSSKEQNTMTVEFWSQGINIPDLDTVSEWIKYKQVIPNPQEEQHVAQPGEVRFLRCVSGNTLGSDDGFIRKLEEEIPGLREEFDVKNCDVILSFCPVVSRAGTDIQSALKKLQDLSETKPAVLVVLHHTFDQELTVPDSSRSVNRVNTLTVDCLFHEDRGLLQCYRNQEALEKVTQWIKPLEKSQSLFQWLNCGIRLGTILDKIPGSSYFFTGPDTQQEIRNAELKAENDKLTKELQKKETLLQGIEETLLSIKNNTNPKRLEDEQHANLMKHLREIEQGKSEETHNETHSSPPPPNTSEGPPNDPKDDFCFL